MALSPYPPPQSRPESRSNRLSANRLFFILDLLLLALNLLLILSYPALIILGLLDLIQSHPWPAAAKFLGALIAWLIFRKLPI